jgi:Trk K+ transport system NAD-binding subunit
MPRLPRSFRRLAALLLALPILLLALALIYQAGMAHLEGQPRTLGESLQWAAATLTTTGYGRDVSWHNGLMEMYVIFVQFAGVMLIFLVVPVFLIPFFEERFEVRLPTVLPKLDNHVFIYRYGPAVTSLLEELEQAHVPVVIFEEDEPTARRLHEREHEVVLGNLEEDDPDLSNLVGARGVVLNGDDDDNAAVALSARYHGYDGPIVALVTNPNRRPPMLRAGANTAFTPDHVLAAAIAARASVKISPRVSGVRQLGHHLEVAELRVHANSPFAGQTIAEARIRAQTGAIIVGLWVGGRLVRQPSVGTTLDVGNILVVVGSQPSIERLGALATPVRRPGPFLVVGYGRVGHKVAEFLRDADETVRVLDAQAADGVDLVGDPLNPDALKQAGAAEAQAVVLALDTDSATLFAAAVVRNLAPEVVIIAGASRAENVSRIHRAGADFALSVGQVAGQLLAYHLLGHESVSLEAEIKLVATSAGDLVGRPLDTDWIRAHTGCSVVAIARGDEIIVEFGHRFEVQPDDVVCLSGTKETIAEFFKAFPGALTSPIPRRHTALVDGPEAGPGGDALEP